MPRHACWKFVMPQDSEIAPPCIPTENLCAHNKKEIKEPSRSAHASTPPNQSVSLPSFFSIEIFLLFGGFCSFSLNEAVYSTYPVPRGCLPAVELFLSCSRLHRRPRHTFFARLEPVTTRFPKVLRRRPGLRGGRAPRANMRSAAANRK